MHPDAVYLQSNLVSHTMQSQIRISAHHNGSAVPFGPTNRGRNALHIAFPISVHKAPHMKAR